MKLEYGRRRAERPLGGRVGLRESEGKKGGIGPEAIMKRVVGACLGGGDRLKLESNPTSKRVGWRLFFYGVQNREVIPGEVKAQWEERSTGCLDYWWAIGKPRASALVALAGTAVAWTVGCDSDSLFSLSSLLEDWRPPSVACFLRRWRARSPRRA